MENRSLLICNARLVGNGRDHVGSVLVCDGRIAAIYDEAFPAMESEADETVDAAEKLLTYGLADVHVHFREPGYSYKETMASGSRAAARGGYTVVCTMPNLNPVPDCGENLKIQQDIIDRDAVIDVRPYCSITEKRLGERVVDVFGLKDKCVGFSDDGSGVQDEAVMEEAMREIAAADSILAAHCEDNSLLRRGYIHDGGYAREHGHRGICSESEWRPIVRDIEIAGRTGCRYHVCHVSAKESVEAVRRGKKAGVKVSCETGPHYLVLSDKDLQEEGRFKMNPPLRGEDDRKALLEGIADGTVEVIATDHAPHSAEEKSKGLEGSAMGIVGLETSFPVLYTRLVEPGVFSLGKLIELMSENPRRIFRLGGGLKVGEKADLALFDLSESFGIDSGSFLSKGKATPFEGMTVRGKCVLTLKEGKKVWEEK